MLISRNSEETLYTGIVAMYGFNILLKDIKRMLYCCKGVFGVFLKMKQATFYKRIYIL